MLPSAQAFTHRAYRNLQDRAQKHSKYPDLVFLPKWQKQAAHKVMPRGQQFSQHPYVLGHLNRLGILNMGCQPRKKRGQASHSWRCQERNTSKVGPSNMVVQDAQTGAKEMNTTAPGPGRSQDTVGQARWFRCEPWPHTWRASAVPFCIPEARAASDSPAGIPVSYWGWPAWPQNCCRIIFRLRSWLNLFILKSSLS